MIFKLLKPTCWLYGHDWKWCREGPDRDKWVCQLCGDVREDVK